MNKNDLFEAFDGMDDDILARSEAATPRRKAPRVRKWGALAACAALVMVLGGIAVAAEAKEYHAAVEFFEDYGLPTEGLSRADVKAVYRDIITQRFAYGKTAEVLERRVPGLEITQREPAADELEDLWDRNVWNLWYEAQPGAGISYRREYLDREDAALGFSVYDKTILECYRNGNLLWTAEFSDFVAEGSAYTSAGTAVWGYTYRWFSEQPSHGWLARMDEDGNILWQRELVHGFKGEDVEQVLDNGDGTWAVISREDYAQLCLSQYDTDGNELSFRRVKAGQVAVQNAARFGDGYLVQLRNISSGGMSTKDAEHVVKLDREGNLIDDFTYEGKDCDYHITDMVEFGNRVCLSAYAVPKQGGEGGRYEIANILDYVFEKENWEISNEELTALVRGNYTAVLLLCDPEGGAPRTFYSVKGSLGGDLSVNGAGELTWDVESVADTFFSPATSSFTIGGACQVFRYAFDDAGNLLRQEDTGETVPYRR